MTVSITIRIFITGWPILEDNFDIQYNIGMIAHKDSNFDPATC